MVRPVLKFAVFAALAVLTLLARQFVPTEVGRGDQLLPVLDCRSSSGWIVHVAAGGSLDCSSGTVTMTNADPAHSSSLRFTLPDMTPGVRYLVSATVRTDAVVPGPKAWNRARLVLAQYDAKGRWLPGSLQLFSLDGSHDWQHFRGTMQVQKRTGRAELSLRLSRVSGGLEAKDLSLFFAAPNPRYPWVRAFACLVWGLFLVWLALPRLWSAPGRIQRLVLSAVLLTLLVGVALPGPEKLQLLNQIEQVATEVTANAQLVPEAAAALHWPSDPGKVGHFVLFGLLALGMLRATGGRGPQALLLDITLFAAATEFLQTYVPGRAPSVEDWLLDTCGALAALALADLLRRRDVRSRG